MYFCAKFFYPRFRPTSSFGKKIRICDHRSMTDYHRKRLSKCAASNLGWRRIGRMDFIIRAAAVSTDYRGLFQLSVWICRGPLTPNLLSVRVSLDSLRTKKNLWFKRRSNMSSTIRPSISSLYRAQKIGSSSSISKKKFSKTCHCRKSWKIKRGITQMNGVTVWFAIQNKPLMRRRKKGILS